MLKLSVLAPLISIIVIVVGSSHQGYLIVKHSDSKEVSLFQNILGITVSAVWVAYGWQLGNPSIYINSFLAICVNGILGGIIIYYRKRLR